VLLPTLLALPVAQADAAGDAWLAKVDAALNRGKDAHFVLSVSVTDKSGTVSDRVLEIWQKGSAQRLVRFTAPSRLAGTGLLVPDGDTLYLYLPAYGRARRIVGESRGDAFMGTDFSLEDLSRLDWASDFTAVVESESGGQAGLRLTPRNAADHRDASVRLSVRTADNLVERIDHLDAAGASTRTITLSDWRPEGDSGAGSGGAARTFAHTLVVDDPAHGKRTVATLMRVELDTGLGDDRFTLDALTRP
jgi:outer membrane lipoprotein-sorting protein